MVTNTGLESAIARAASALNGVAAVYLFGSHAAGRSHRESDVDIGILLDRHIYGTPAARFEMRVRLTAILMPTLFPSAPDVVVLNDAPPTLAASIVTRGRQLACADAEAEHAFRRDVQLRAADLRPFLHRTRRVKLQSLARR
jgi:predicted nucleotidyltransferase